MSTAGRQVWPKVEDPVAWLQEYYRHMRSALFDTELTSRVVAMREHICACRDAGGKLIFAGNGASASIASHCAVDYTKQARVRAVSFNEPNLITCYANDYGFEHWIEQALAHQADAADVIVLISSSGKSVNVLNAARHARQRGLSIVTFTGFSQDNPLSQLGDLNFWVNSRSYNIVECTHMFWLMMVCDLIVGKAEYEVPRGEGS